MIFNCIPPFSCSDNKRANMTNSLIRLSNSPVFVFKRTSICPKPFSTLRILMKSNPAANLRWQRFYECLRIFIWYNCKFSSTIFTGFLCWVPIFLGIVQFIALYKSKLIICLTFFFLFNTILLAAKYDSPKKHFPALIEEWSWISLVKEKYL